MRGITSTSVPLRPIPSPLCRSMLVALLLALAPQLANPQPAPARATERGIAIDERLASDAGLRIGDRVSLSSVPGAPGDTVRIAAIVGRTADPAEIARGEYRVRVH